METIRHLHDWWRNISHFGFSAILLGSFALFLAACLWWDQTITFERNAFFVLGWCLLNLLRAKKPALEQEASHGTND